MTHTLVAEVEVNVPVSTAYHQWTQFEDFPAFLSDVKSVEQIDETSTHWVVSVGGVWREFDARIVDQVRDSHVEWASTDGRVHSGRVSFDPITENRTLVALELVWEPQTFLEHAGAAIGLDERRVDLDLMRFKEFMESRPGGIRHRELHADATER